LFSVIEANEDGPFILEGNPDVNDPISRGELDSLIQQPPYVNHKVLPNRTVKVKQHQDYLELGHAKF
jgi:hypothetical protein